MPRSRVLTSVAVGIALFAGPAVAAAAEPVTAVPAASADGGLVPGATTGLGRIVVALGTHYLGPQDEMLHGTLTLDADLGAPALAVPSLREFTDADQAAGRMKPSVHGVAPSPDGRRLAFWVTDPDGFVVPGGTPPWGEGYTGESLVVMDVDGRNRRVVHDNPASRDPDHLEAWPGTRMTWLDDRTLLVPGRAPRTFPASGNVGVGRTVDVETGVLGTALKYDDGGQQVRNIDQTAAGGGTAVGLDMGTLVRIVHRTGAEAPIDPSADDDSSTIRDVDVSADGDHIAFIERTPVGDGTVSSRVGVLDYAGDGEWTERTIVDNVGDWWVRWLPYESVDASHLLVHQEGDGGTVYSVATDADVPEDQRVAVVTQSSDVSHSEWVVQPLPSPGSASADVEVEAGELVAQTGEPFDASLRVTNNGPDAATGVRLEVGTSEGVLSALAGAGATCVADTGTCELGDLAVGESVTVEATAPPLAAGVARLEAEVTAAETDWNTGNSALDAQVPVRVPPYRGNDVGQLIRTAGSCDLSTGPCTMRIVTEDSDGTDQEVVVDGGDAESLALWDVHRRTGLFLWSSEDRRTGASSWHVSELDGSLVRSFTKPEGMLSGVITPDGRTLVYFRRDDRVNQPLYSLMTLRLDVPDAQPKLLVPGGTARIPNHFRVSPDGTRVAYLTVAQGYHGAAAHVVDLDGRHDRDIRVPSSPTGSPIVQPHQLVWSPDGERIALSVSYTEPYDPSNLVLMPVNGGSAVDLGLGPTDGSAYFEILDWSPDGAEILAATNSGLVGVDVSGGTRQEYAVEGKPWWTGLPLTDGGPDPVEDTTAPTGSYTASASAYLKPGGALTLSRTALADDVDTRSDLDVLVTWGDGAVTEGDGATDVFQHAYDDGGVHRVTVAVTDRAGNRATLFDQTFTVDGAAPVVTVSEPSCGKRKPKACADYRETAGAWSKATGTVVDDGGSGVREVLVTAVQKRGRAWWALSDGGWKKYGKKGAAERAAAEMPATVRRKKWTVPLAPSAGKLVLRATGRDHAGNESGVGYSTTLSR